MKSLKINAPVVDWQQQSATEIRYSHRKAVENARKLAKSGANRSLIQRVKDWFND